jgi:hypothetical protein
MHRKQRQQHDIGNQRHHALGRPNWRRTTRSPAGSGPWCSLAGRSWFPGRHRPLIGSMSSYQQDRSARRIGFLLRRQVAANEKPPIGKVQVGGGWMAHKEPELHIYYADQSKQKQREMTEVPLLCANGFRFTSDNRITMLISGHQAREDFKTCCKGLLRRGIAQTKMCIATAEDLAWNDQQIVLDAFFRKRSCG